LTKLQLAGVFFLRFGVNENDSIIDIRTSNSAHPYFANIIEKSLVGNKLVVNQEVPKGTFFVIPIIFNFHNNKPYTFGRLSDVPVLDMEKYRTRGSRNEFEEFFNLDIKTGEKSAALCIMLPWINYIDMRH
jgi:hypothetical protein